MDGNQVAIRLISNKLACSRNPESGYLSASQALRARRKPEVKQQPLPQILIPLPVSYIVAKCHRFYTAKLIKKYTK